MKLSKQYWEKERVIIYSRNQWPLKRAVLWLNATGEHEAQEKGHNRGKDI